MPLTGIETALDAGCGTGFPLIELAERLGRDAAVHGVDPWSGALARAAEKVKCRATPNVILHEASATAMPFADGHFDLIVSNLGLNNFDDRIGALRECRRVARKGAVLALTTNLQGHMQELYAIFEEVLTRHGLASELASLREHVAHRATVAAVRELLESNGFQVTRVVVRSARMRFASGSALFNHYFIKLGFLDAWKKVVTGRETEIFPELEEQLDRYAAGHGGLSLTIPMAYVEAQAV